MALSECRDFEIGLMLQQDPRAAEASREAELEWLKDQAYYKQLEEEYYAEQALFHAQLDELETQGIFARLLLHPEYREHLFIERYTHGPVPYQVYIDEEVPF
tara:strand:- start:391 stop:696 length:306 start_codon:yes stop_codon:yes gene_type:complete